jgi:DNA-binding Lrp family transcriptional regulator
VPGPEREHRIDELDARLLRELDESPRVGVLELSRRLGVARGTVQARLDRLVERGVIASFAPTLDPVALGFAVTGFATLEIRQGQGQAVLAHLAEIPEVLEVHTITGPGDMLCRVVARSNADLQRVLDRLTQHPEIVRTSTVIALSNPVRHRVLPLVRPTLMRPTTRAPDGQRGNRAT